MPDTLSIALLGCWHVHAEEYARAALEHTHTSLTTVWDDDPGRGSSVAEKLGVRFTESLDDVLADPGIMAVVVTTATTRHTDIITAAVRAGKHVFSEKLLAPTVEECEALIAEAAEHHVSIVVSLPKLTEAATVTARQIVGDGLLGELTYGRVRMAHDGWINDWLPERFAVRADAVGGALSDLGCHPASLTQLFFGDRPVSVSAEYGSFSGREVEDNAVVTARYANGAIGVFEASFVTTPGAFAFELRGTEGSLLYGFGSERMLVKGARFDSERWTEVALRDAEQSPFASWVGHALGGTRDIQNLRAATELTRMVVAANRSARDGAHVQVRT
ncbi:Gfo/Idh/MocA family oxidoreductase [Okibacterium endophyticum]